MSKPPSTPSSSRPGSRPGSIRAFDLFASTKSLKSLKLETSHEDLPYGLATGLHYDKREVPYPLSLEKESLELYSLDRALMYRVKGACSFVDFNNGYPRRCLDLGTGLGDWIIDAAQAWPDCTFVGFDVADIQIDLRYVDPSIAHRVQWIHGNFLEHLPFEDNEFDFVHLFGTAFCVPEDKWHFFFDEINRVLKPGGHVEILEEDAIFPVLPRWFTRPLHSQSRHSLPPSKSNVSVPLASSEFSHDFALLEMLFLSSFESRFVNPTPSCILPGYFSASFNHVISPPILLFPMPPLAPLPPLPEMPPAQKMAHRSMVQQSMQAIQDYSLPPIVPTVPLDSQLGDLSPLPSAPSSARPSMGSQHTIELERVEAAPSTGNDVQAHIYSIVHPPKGLGSVAMPAFAEQGETTEMGGQAAYDLFCMDVIANLDEHAAYAHLKRMAGLVNSAKEAMLDELMALVVQGDRTLERYGWEEEDYTEEISREKFNLLWEQYIMDLNARISLWHPMMQYGWRYPRRDPMTKAELLDEERIRQAIIQARRFARPDEIQPTMRAIRLLVGAKES
ncbi:hypothetical protein NM688_g4360 [Phlebia brevispora]|uniref:Uncharacterized protein n=1 Tax=Phlebia brevispora TaxID=194682 RepID=A0ACC1T353_9APHY|nr:hypothetical protein NM688_g4360 [Phlebia brevispora]